MTDVINQLTARIIPCLDVDNGRVVKGTNFVNLRDMGDPVELAIRYEQQGADEIVFLDISASSDNRPTALKNVTAIAKNLSIPFTVGGGLKTINDVKAFLDAGADKVALNTTAVTNPEIIDQVALDYGSQCVVVAVDVNQENDERVIYIHGGRTRVNKNFNQWVNEVEQRGAGEILLTCMHKDGTGSGFDNQLTGAVANNSKIQVIASGGAKNEQHFLEAFKAGADACLAAGMFHSGEYTIGQVKQFLNDNGVQVRL
ncbi:imidazole glycerol phosphate synthase subunit HisF [Pleionea mediterranea]|uniref:Imidazole glycerol phosphate synthase subunit HisF n=1 Tax=Pleionea mediterranea TaxID=523701 RepID=A0A316FSX1_9GAMM|nr:imidazole glycerol phosphate synthase subunit HisF [Pleionea mediterranea]PWK50720.1 cyclase [Pleionea mediterranea]